MCRSPPTPARTATPPVTPPPTTLAAATPPPTTPAPPATPQSPDLVIRLAVTSPPKSKCLETTYPRLAEDIKADMERGQYVSDETLLAVAGRDIGKKQLEAMIESNQRGHNETGAPYPDPSEFPFLEAVKEGRYENAKLLLEELKELDFAFHRRRVPGYYAEQVKYLALRAAGETHNGSTDRRKIIEKLLCKSTDDLHMVLVAMADRHASHILPFRTNSDMDPLHKNGELMRVLAKKNPGIVIKFAKYYPEVDPDVFLA